MLTILRLKTLSLVTDSAASKEMGFVKRMNFQRLDRHTAAQHASMLILTQGSIMRQPGRSSNIQNELRPELLGSSLAFVGRPKYRFLLHCIAEDAKQLDEWNIFSTFESGKEFKRKGKP